MPPTSRKPVKGKTFHPFPRLPIEIRLHIWSYTIGVRFVEIRWHPATRDFRSANPVPTLLHINNEARIFGLKTYQLSFASSPEFARVYFSFRKYGDVLSIDWDSLGTIPGRIGRKLSVEELRKIRYLLVREAQLLGQTENNMKEWARFENLNVISVICDEDIPESGGTYGHDEMAAYAESIEGGGKEKWPDLVCLRDPQEDLGGPCSRHWWFEGWNQRASVGQKAKWPTAISQCLQATKEPDENDLYMSLMLLTRIQQEGDLWP